ncbi:MAG: DUF1571 domain-containing protein [Myxococcaceae bacterium]
MDELAAQALTMPAAGRRAAMAALTRGQQAELMKQLPQATLVKIGRQSVDSLNTYSAVLVKRERVGGELLPGQRCEIHVREKPFAVLMDFVDGPGPTLRIIEKDLKQAEPRGGHTRVDEGFDKEGLYCLMAKAPNGGKGFYAVATRICSDVMSGLPLRVESFDAKGMFESFTFSKVKPLPLPDSFFTLQGTGL